MKRKNKIKIKVENKKKDQFGIFIKQKKWPFLF